MYCDTERVKGRLCLLDGFARESNLDSKLPSSISKLCDKYGSSAIYWRIGTETLQYLLSNHAEFTNNVMTIGSFQFILALRNEKGSIIFEIVPLKIPTQCTDRIYCELYCIETQTQYKRTHLFDTGTGLRAIATSRQRISVRRYPHCKWTCHHLSEKQCENKRRLTFAVHMNILNESECQISLPSNIEYKWNLRNINCNPKCKIYSPNIGGNCWCLWYMHDLNEETITVGLQLLKLPNNRSNGIIFRCSIDYEGNVPRNDKAIKFIYFLDLINSQVQIGKIPKNISWIKTGIYLNIDDNAKWKNKKVLIRTLCKDFRYRAQPDTERLCQFSVMNKIYKCSLVLSFFNLNTLFNYRLISRTFYLACHWAIFISSSLLLPVESIQREKSRQYVIDVGILNSSFRF